MKMKPSSILPFVGVVLLSVSGCKTLEKVSEIGASIGVATGTISHGEAESIKRSSKAVAKTFSDITPEQEYYIGRAVGATVVSCYKPYDREALTQYINLLGQTLAQASDLPNTFGGYHFLVLDSDEINAFAAPGGLIFVSRGMLRLCKNEDDVAAILAHEIGHVQDKHGLKAIKKGRLTSALTILAAEGAKQFGGEQLAQLTEAFEGSISDITSTMMNSGYARKLETGADGAAVTILKRVGYDPSALTRVLEAMKKQLKPDGEDFAKTHPDPDVRIAAVSAQAGAGLAKTSSARQKRFKQAMRGI